MTQLNGLVAVSGFEPLLDAWEASVLTVKTKRPHLNKIKNIPFPLGNGEPGEIRTRDLFLAKEALSRLSYGLTSRNTKISKSDEIRRWTFEKFQRRIGIRRLKFFKCSTRRLLILEFFLDEVCKPSVSVHSLVPIICGAKSLTEWAVTLSLKDGCF